MNGDQLWGAGTALAAVLFGIWLTGHDASAVNVIGIGLGFLVGAAVLRLIASESA